MYLQYVFAFINQTAKSILHSISQIIPLVLFIIIKKKKLLPFNNFCFINSTLFLKIVNEMVPYFHSLLFHA